MLSAEQRETLLGPGNTSAVVERERARARDGVFRVDLDPIGTTGGVDCLWFAAEGADLPEGASNLGVSVLPTSVVRNEFAARYSVALCEPSYDSGLCRLGKRVGDTWVMATVGWAVYDAPIELLSAAIDSVSTNLAGATQPQPASYTGGVWSIPDCVRLGEAIALEELIGPYVHGYWEGSEQPEDVLLSAAGAERRCPLYSDGDRIDYETQEFYILDPLIAPGLGWQWAQLRADSEGSSRTVDVLGASDAFAVDQGLGFNVVVATDGKNVVSLYSDDVDLAAEILGRIIVELSN